jgi:hypothetical protein
VPGSGNFIELHYSDKPALTLIKGTFLADSSTDLSSRPYSFQTVALLFMLTVEKLMILLNYNWDAYLFERTGSAAEKALLADLDWGKYELLLQDLVLVSKNLVSKEYAHHIHQQLLAACADEATAQTFIGYASTL